jgi:hypothetical protein
MPQLSGNEPILGLNKKWQRMGQKPTYPKSEVHKRSGLCNAKIWAVRICAPRSSVQIQLWTPPVILPLMGRGGPI